MLLAFVGTCLLIELTPGPNMIYLAVVAASRGRKLAFYTVCGVALGLLIVGMATALGLAAVINASSLLYQALRVAGVCYLLWLAWDGWRDADAPVAEAPTDRVGLRYFRRGLITNLLNPKAAVFYVAVLPSFVTPTAPVVPQTILLSLSFVIIATVIHSTIVVLAGTASTLLQNPQRSRIIRRALAVALACVAIWFVWDTAI
ncbi:LysE family translocator [Loktanella agnita]|uniref:LysE family translocator n=1 Tax=Loktanella agnita TaxID=287097 RepID=UPI003985EE89